MKSQSKTRQRKRRVTVTLDGNVVMRARALTPNLSRTVETLIRGYVAHEETRRLGRTGDIEHAITMWNRFAEQHGSISEEHSTL